MCATLQQPCARSCTSRRRARAVLRVFLVFVHDVTAAAVAWVLAYWLRFNMEITPTYVDFMLETIFWVVPAQALVFWSFGLYRGIWRYASLQDLQRLLRAV